MKIAMQGHSPQAETDQRHVILDASGMRAWMVTKNPRRWHHLSRARTYFPDEQSNASFFIFSPIIPSSPGGATPPSMSQRKHPLSCDDNHPSCIQLTQHHPTPASKQIGYHLLSHMSCQPPFTISSASSSPSLIHLLKPEARRESTEANKRHTYPHSYRNTASLSRTTTSSCRPLNHTQRRHSSVPLATNDTLPPLLTNPVASDSTTVNLQIIIKINK